MDGKKVLEYGVIFIVILFVWRWINAAMAGIGGNTVQSSDYYQPGFPYSSNGYVSMYGSPVGWGPYDGRSWSGGDYGGWYNGGDYGSGRGRHRVGDPGGSKRW